MRIKKNNKRGIFCRRLPSRYRLKDRCGKKSFLLKDGKYLKEKIPSREELIGTIEKYYAHRIYEEIDRKRTSLALASTVELAFFEWLATRPSISFGKLSRTWCFYTTRSEPVNAHI